MAFRARNVFGTFEKWSQARIVQKVDDAIHRINHYPLDSAIIIGFAMTFPLDSDLAGVQCYPPFEQLGPELYWL